MAAKLNHWFASSAVYWRVASTVAELVREMDRLDHYGSDYSIYQVPLPLDAHYMIEQHMPVVDGVEFFERVTTMGEYSPANVVIEAERLLETSLEGNGTSNAEADTLHTQALDLVRQADEELQT
jgi:hypothetical protein